MPVFVTESLRVLSDVSSLNLTKIVDFGKLYLMALLTKFSRISLSRP